MPRLSHTSKPQQLNHPEVDVSLLSSVQFSDSVMSDSLQPHVLQHTRPPCPSPSPRACSNSCPLTRVMPSNHRILCHPLLLLPSIFPSIRAFSNESALCIMWPKYWSFSISPKDSSSSVLEKSGIWDHKQRALKQE